MYLEGVKNGRRFFKVLKEVAARKPVVIWKGGRTQEGNRAIASHTGSLAVPQGIWDAAVKQCGAIRVTEMEELIDTLKALLYLPPVHGDRVGVAGGSGGESVAIADIFAEAGLKVPLLTQKSYDEFATFFSLIGAGYRNPIDQGGANRKEMKRILEILERDGNVDNLVLLAMVGSPFLHPGQIESDADSLLDIRQKTSKPVMAVVPASTPQEVRKASDITQKFQDGGVPAFPSIKRGANALRNALDYYNLRSNN
jgi:acyl-CoA synthetase (NDP forming)